MKNARLHNSGKFKKIYKVLGLLLCFLFLTGCSEKAPEEIYNEFNGEIENVIDKKVEYIANESGLNKEKTKFNLKLKEELKSEVAYVQINAICYKNSYEFPGDPNYTTEQSNEIYLKLIPVDEKIEVSKYEVENLFKSFADTSKFSGNGLGYVEYKYGLKFRIVEFKNNKWCAGEWKEDFNKIPIMNGPSDFEIKADIIKVLDKSKFASEIKIIVEEKNTEQLILKCHFPVTLNGVEYTKEDFVNQEIWPDYFVESIKLADTNNVLLKDNKYILTSSEYGIPNITFELINDEFFITSITHKE